MFNFPAKKIRAIMSAEDIQLFEQEQALLAYEGEDKIISSYDMLDRVVSVLDESKPIYSDFPELDRVLGGFEGGELTVVSGLSGNGKTLFSQTLTLNMAGRGINSVWFSYEVMPKNFLKAFGESLPLFYMPSVLKDNTLDWLENRIQEAKVKFGCKCVFIDHLHFLVDMRTRNNMSLEIGYTMRSLKKIALRLNICIFLIAHTSKIKTDSELGLDSLRDSSFIAQESDNVLMIWRKLDSEREAYLKVCKNRKYGVFAKIPLIRNSIGYLVELEDYARI